MRHHTAAAWALVSAPTSDKLMSRMYPTVTISASAPIVSSIGTRRIMPVARALAAK